MRLDDATQGTRGRIFSCVHETYRPLFGGVLLPLRPFRLDLEVLRQHPGGTQKTKNTGTQEHDKTGAAKQRTARGQKQEKKKIRHWAVMK